MLLVELHHIKSPPCSHLTATVSEDKAALGSLQASPQAPSQSTGVTGGRRRQWFLPRFSAQFGMPNYYFYPGSPLQPPGDSGNRGCNTRPLKHLPANSSFFTLLIHSEATRPIVSEDNTDLNGSTADPQAPYQPQGWLVRGEPWIAMPT
ncbi:UNVERIFIED_CONTAM: hypothetical protein FKN15_001251 [Acipenser sinensis]